MAASRTGWVLALGLLVACKGGLSLEEKRAFRCTRGATSVEEGACPEGLHCGVEGFCYSRENTGQDAGFACEVGGDDCVEGWFCGYDARCHPASVAAAYACAADAHCVKPWRCGPDAVCVDPSQDALRTDAPEVTLEDVHAFTPERPWERVDAIAAGSPFTYPLGGQSTEVTSILVAEGEALTTVLYSDSERGFGGPGALPPHLTFGKVSLGGGVAPVDLAAAHNQLFALQAGQLHWLEWQLAPVGADGDGGTPILSSVNPPLESDATRLRTTDADHPLIAELGTHSYRIHSPTKRASGGPWATPDAGVKNGELFDLVDTGQSYLLASFGGMFYGAHRAEVLAGSPFVVPKPDWWPVRVQLHNSPAQLTDCNGAGDAGYGVRGIQVWADRYSNAYDGRIGLELEAHGVDGGGRGTHWAWLEPHFSASCGVAGRPEFRAYGMCRVCREGEVLVDLGWAIGQSSDGTSYAQLKSECRTAAGGIASYALGMQQDNIGCRLDPVSGDGAPSASAKRSRSSSFVRAQAEGTKASIRTHLNEQPLPLVMDRAPDVLAKLDGRVIAMGNKTLYQEVPGFGLAVYNRSRGEDGFPAAVVPEQPNWLIFDDGSVADTSRLDLAQDGPPLIARSSRGGLEPPFMGNKASLPDGGVVLVMSAFDSLLAADMTAIAEGTSTSTSIAELEVKTVPLPRIPILSVAVLPQPDTGTGASEGLLSGYVLTKNRLFGFRAQSEQRWDLVELNVPDGDWVEVWADKRRGRVGYRDGKVYALPSRVQIADALPGDERVADYVHFCQRSYALSDEGLYRLDARSDSAVGTWVRQNLRALDTVGGKWVKLHVAGNELFAFTEDGRGVRMRGAPCDSP